MKNPESIQNFVSCLHNLRFMRLAALALATQASANDTVFEQDLSTYPSGTYLSEAGWTMATNVDIGTGQIQITNTSGFAPANAVAGSTATGRGGYVAAYRTFTEAQQPGGSLTMTTQLYLRPNLEYARIGFWDGSVADGGNGDPHGVYLAVGQGGSFYLDQSGSVTSPPSFGPPLVEGIYSVVLHLDSSSQTALATVITPDSQSFASSPLVLTDKLVEDMVGVQLYVKNHYGSTQADFSGTLRVTNTPVLTILASHGTVPGSGHYTSGTMVELVATPDLGYLFNKWTGDASGTANPLSVLLDSSKTITAVFVTDSRDPDGDGLTNYEELVTYGTNPNVADTDGDGFSDGYEVHHGTLPKDPASRPDATLQIFTAVEVRLDTALGQSYRMESSTDLQTWTTVEEHIAGTGGTVTRFYSIQEIPKRFFRPVRE